MSPATITAPYQTDAPLGGVQSRRCFAPGNGLCGKLLTLYAARYEIEGFLGNGAATFLGTFGIKREMCGMRPAPTWEPLAPITLILSKTLDFLQT